MAATVSIQRITGAPASKTYTTVTNVRLRTDDANTQDLTNPVKKPTSGFNYSYWASICLDLSGTFSQISNIRHYSDGAIGWNLGTGGGLFRGNRDTGDIGCPDASYEQAGGTQGTTGYAIDDATNGHTYYNTQTTPVVDVSNDTSSSPAVVDSSTYTAAGKTKHIVLQAKVASDATAGVQAAETLTWEWDEI